MKFLFDTNAIIPAEPTDATHVEPGTSVIADLLGLIGLGRHQVYVHPASITELRGDRNSVRRELRATLLQKYIELPSPPAPSSRLTSLIGTPKSGTHDAVDHQLLAAVDANAVDVLVTDDQGIIKNAQKAQLSDRVLSSNDAVAMLRGLLRAFPEPPPAVRKLVCHALDEGDPIFESLRADYEGFDEWFKTCKLRHRPAWVIHRASGVLAGICIMKDENENEHGLSGQLLKLCTFKIADTARGLRYGELLLKTVFHYVLANKYEWIYLEIFETKSELIRLLESFGFHRREGATTKRGEIVLVKRGRFDQLEYDASAPLEFSYRYGPLHVKALGVPAFVIPIMPRYHDLLFPELTEQTTIFTGTNPYGNSIEKAYLSRSKSRLMQAGSPILFYRSGGPKDVRCLGVAERTLVSADPNELARFVGQRTVYTFDEIAGMCDRPVLAILFRQARTLPRPLSLKELIERGVLSGVPQSIVQVREEGNPWLKTQIEAWP